VKDPLLQVWSCNLREMGVALLRTGRHRKSGRLSEIFGSDQSGFNALNRITVATFVLYVIGIVMTVNAMLVPVFGVLSECFSQKTCSHQPPFFSVLS